MRAGHLRGETWLAGNRGWRNDDWICRNCSLRRTSFYVQQQQQLLLRELRIAGQVGQGEDIAHEILWRRRAMRHELAC